MSSVIDFDAIRAAAERGEILINHFVLEERKCLMCWVSENVHKVAKILYDPIVDRDDIPDGTPTSFCKEEVLPLWMASIVPQLTDHAQTGWSPIIDAVEKVHEASKEDREKIRAALIEEKLISPYDVYTGAYALTSYTPDAMEKLIDIIRSHQ
jgi:hypothetical protein